MTELQEKNIFRLITYVLNDKAIPVNDWSVRALIENTLKKNKYECFFCPTEECEKKLRYANQIQDIFKAIISHLKSQITLKREILDLGEFDISYRDLSFVCIPLKAYLNYLNRGKQIKCSQ